MSQFSWLRRSAPRIGCLFAILVATACSDFRAQQLMRTAATLGAQEKWSEALHYYERLWLQYPESDLVDSAKLLAAEIYSGPEANTRSAVELYEDLIVHGRTEDVRSRSILALAELYERSPESRLVVIQLYRLYLKKYSHMQNVHDVTLKLGETLVDAGKFADAIEVALPLTNNASQLDQERATLIVAHAQELGGHATAALPHYEKVAQQAKKGSDNWLNAMEGQARTLEQSGRWQDAVVVVRELRDNHPNPDAIEHWLLTIFERRKDMKR